VKSGSTAVPPKAGSAGWESGQEVTTSVVDTPAPPVWRRRAAAARAWRARTSMSRAVTTPSGFAAAWPWTGDLRPGATTVQRRWSRSCNRAHKFV